MTEEIINLLVYRSIVKSWTSLAYPLYIFFCAAWDKEKKKYVGGKKREGGGGVGSTPFILSFVIHKFEGINDAGDFVYRD